jgi:hypothetical protein
MRGGGQWLDVRRSAFVITPIPTIQHTITPPLLHPPPPRPAHHPLPVTDRYFGKEAAQIIIKLAAGNGFKKVYVGQDAIMPLPPPLSQTHPPPLSQHLLCPP